MGATGEIWADLTLHDQTAKGLSSASANFKAAESTLTGAAAKMGQGVGTALTKSVSSNSAVGSILSKSIALSSGAGLAGTAALSGISATLTALGTEAAKTFQTFDDQMRKVGAVTSATDSEFKALTNTAKVLGATTSFTAQDASEAMTYLGQAGFDANQIISAMPATLDLARGSMTDLATTADIMSNIMNGFQIPAENTAYAADVLAAAANKTNTDVQGLGQAMKYAAPLAHQMGWSLQETAAAAGLLSNAGIKADMAGTVIRNSITRLIAPTDKVVGILDSYGLTVDQLSPKTHNLATVLDTLTAAGVSSADIMQIFGMRAGPGMMALLNQGTDALRNMETELSNSKGYAAEAADAMDAGFGGAVREAGNAIEALQLSLGQAIASIATPFLQVFAVVGKSIAALPQPILVSVAAMGALVTAGLAVVSALAALGFLFTGLSAAAAAFGITLSVSIWPITAVVVAVGALAAGLYILEEKTGLVSAAFNYLSDWATIFGNAISVTFNELKRAVSIACEGIKNAVLGMIPDSVLNTVSGFLDLVSKQWGNHVDQVSDAADKIRAKNEGIADSFDSWGKFDPSVAERGIATVDDLLGSLGSTAEDDTALLSEMGDVSFDGTNSGLDETDNALLDVSGSGTVAADALSQTGSVSFTDTISGVQATDSAMQGASGTAQQLTYVISDAGNVRMDGTNFQIVSIDENGKQAALSIADLKSRLDQSGNVSQAGTVGQLALVDSTGKATNITTQQAITLLQNAGNQPMTGTIAGWNGVSTAIKGAVSDAYKFIEVNNSRLAGKWATSGKVGKSYNADNQDPTGKVKIVSSYAAGSANSNIINVKINTVNNNGSSVSASKLKKAGV